MYARNGDFLKSEEYYKSAIDNAKSPAQTRNQQSLLADLYWTYGKRNKAAQIFQESFDEFSKLESKIQAFMLDAHRAWQYHLAGEISKAENIIENAMKVAIDSEEEIMFVNVQMAKARLLNAQNRAEEAMPLFENIEKVVQSYLKDGNKLDINYIRGQSYFSLGKFDKALEPFLAINDQFPNRSEFVHWITKTYLAMDELPKAKQFNDQVLSLAPGYPAYNFTMAKILIASDQLPQAKEYLVKALNGWQHADMKFDDIIEAEKLLAAL